jgi:hypothetical protein
MHNGFVPVTKIKGDEINEDDRGGASKVTGEKCMYWGLVGKPEVKKPLGRLHCRL